MIWTGRRRRKESYKPPIQKTTHVYDGVSDLRWWFYSTAAGPLFITNVVGGVGEKRKKRTTAEEDTICTPTPPKGSIFFLFLSFAVQKNRSSVVIWWSFVLIREEKKRKRTNQKRPNGRLTLNLFCVIAFQRKESFLRATRPSPPHHNHPSNTIQCIQQHALLFP